MNDKITGSPPKGTTGFPMEGMSLLRIYLSQLSFLKNSIRIKVSTNPDNNEIPKPKRYISPEIKRLLKVIWSCSAKVEKDISPLSLH